MVYDPPDDDDPSREAYDAGYCATADGRPESDNPHKPSGHERDTTSDDEKHYQWWRGWSDGRVARDDARVRLA